MQKNDPSSYNHDNASNGPFWNYGSEVWCNLEGQYVTIVVDASNDGKDYDSIAICSLGIMGTEYGRDEAETVPSSVTVK